MPVQTGKNAKQKDLSQKTSPPKPMVWKLITLATCKVKTFWIINANF